MKKCKIFLFSTLIFIFIISTFSYAAYKSPYIEPTYLVKYGSTGTGVKWVQDLLKQNGYSVTVDGVFGSKTKNAVIHFQKYNNLDTDGIVGNLTREALKKSVSYIQNSSSSSNNNISTNNSSTTNQSTSSVITTVINSYKYTTANVNFRNGASTSNTSYGILPKGTKVYVLQSKSNGWSYVQYNNKYGYISSTYLSNNKPTTSTSNTSNGLATFNRNSSNLLNIIKNCKLYYSQNNFIYSLASGVRSIPADNSKLYNGRYCTDCSTYVSWVLYEYALANGKTAMKNYFSYQRNSATFASIGANGGNNYLSLVNGLSNAKEGDILVSPGHVEFFSSYTKNSNGSVNIKVYNCGSNSSIAASGITTSATKYPSEITYILRVK